MPELTTEERDNIHALLDKLTIDQKKQFLLFLRKLQAQAQEQQPTTASQSASGAAPTPAPTPAQAKR